MEAMFQMESNSPKLEDAIYNLSMKRLQNAEKWPSQSQKVQENIMKLLVFFDQIQSKTQR